jgi:hypothetical protein
MKKILAWLKSWWTTLTYRWTVKEFGRRQEVPIWTAPSDMNQCTGIAWTSQGLFICVTGSFRKKGYSSAIYRSVNGEEPVEVHKGSYETITKGVEKDGVVYFNVEMGSNPREPFKTLVWKDGKIQRGTDAKGKYAIASGVAGGRVLFPFNDSYATWFHDKPRFFDAKSGKLVMTGPRNGFVRSVFDYRGGIGYCCSYSTAPHLYLDGKVVGTKIMKGAARGGVVYGGGSVFAGPEGLNDGGIYRNDGGDDHEIGRLGSQSCEGCWSDGKRVLLAFINRDTIVEITAKGEPRIVVEFPPDTPYPRPGFAFGIDVTVKGNTPWVVRSDNRLVRLYRLD